MKNLDLIVLALVATAVLVAPAPVVERKDRQISSSFAGQSAESAGSAGAASAAGSGGSADTADSAGSAGGSGSASARSAGSAGSAGSANSAGSAGNSAAGCSGSRNGSTGMGLAESNGNGQGNGRDCDDQGTVTGVEVVDGSGDGDDAVISTSAAASSTIDDSDSSTDVDVFPIIGGGGGDDVGGGIDDSDSSTDVDVFPIIGGGGGSDVGGGNNGIGGGGGNNGIGGSGAVASPLSLVVDADFDAVFGANPADTVSQFGGALVGAFQSALNTAARPALLRISRGSVVIAVLYEDQGLQEQLEQLAVDCGLTISFDGTEFALSVASAAIPCSVVGGVGEEPTDGTTADVTSDGVRDHVPLGGASSDMASASSNNAASNSGIIAGLLIAVGLMLIIIAIIAMVSNRRSHAKETGEDGTIMPNKMHWSFDEAGQTASTKSCVSPNPTYQADADKLLDHRISGEYYAVCDDADSPMYCENTALYALPTAVAEVLYDSGTADGQESDYDLGAADEHAGGNPALYASAVAVAEVLYEEASSMGGAPTTHGIANGQESDYDLGAAGGNPALYASPTAVAEVLYEEASSVGGAPTTYDIGTANGQESDYDLAADDELTNEEALRQAAAILEMDVATLRRDATQRNVRGIDAVYNVGNNDAMVPDVGVGNVSTLRRDEENADPVYDLGNAPTLRRDEETADPVYDLGNVPTLRRDEENADPVYNVGNAPTLRRDEENADPVYSVGNILGTEDNIDATYGVADSLEQMAELPGAAAPAYAVGNAPILPRDEETGTAAGIAIYDDVGDALSAFQRGVGHDYCTAAELTQL